MAESEDQSPFTRPGFVVSAIVVGVVLVLGAILGTVGVVNMTRDEPTAAPTTSETVEDSEGPTEAPAGGASVCGLEGEVLEGTVEEAPAVEWDFQGTLGYPASSEYGPGKTDDSGVRSCFQHSPEGALVMAANAMAQVTDPATAESWMRYGLAEGDGRDALLSEGGEVTSGEGVRLQLVGFRVLNYDGETATVDLAIEGSGDGQSITMSAVYSLVWEAGDWKLSVENADAPVDFSTITDTSGYTKWGPNNG